MRMSGKRGLQCRAGALDQLGHARTGTETSCLTLGRPAPPRCSRGAPQLALRCSPRSASQRPPPRAPSASSSARRRSASVGRCRRARPARTRDAAAASGSRVPGMCASTTSRQSREMSSKAVMRSPHVRSRRRASSSTASAGVSTATHAVAVARGLREELQHRGGDDAERALGADEELLQVVAGVVLAQAAQAVPDAAVGQHHLEPEHQLARVAVAQHVDAARVGREVAADLAAALGGERERETGARPLGGLLHRRQHAARLDRHGVVERVDRAHAVHARERSRPPRAACRVGHRAAAQAGVAALRHDRDALARAQRHDASDLVGARRPHHAFRLPAVHAGASR